MLAACDGGGSGSSGSLSLGLTHATTSEYNGVYITIDEVRVHLGGSVTNANNWEVVGSPGKTFNLLELANGVREELGISRLAPEAVLPSIDSLLLTTSGSILLGLENRRILT